MSLLLLCERRSLGIHVTDMDVEESQPPLLGEKNNVEVEEEELKLDVEACSKVSRAQLSLIYSLHLAEAIVASSLQPQLYMLLRDSQLCGSVNSAYWTGLLETTFALGSIAGLYWGRLGDRRGRRPVALAGMLGMTVSCVVMGFSNGLVSCALIRAFAGLMSSSIRVSTATMIGDVSETSSAKARNFSRLPLVATGGVIGPLLQALLAHRFSSDNKIWKTFPILCSQLACASLMFIFFLVNLIFLQETLPTPSSEGFDEETQLLPRSVEFFAEKDTFLGQAEYPATPRRRNTFKDERPEPIRFSEIMRAPSLMILLCSYSFLSLHSASFDQLLPLLGNSSTEHGGLGLPCFFLSLVVLFAGIAAGVVIYLGFAKSVQRLGLLQLYRLCCWIYPVIYTATPLLSKVAVSSQVAVWISSASSIFTKTLVTGFAQTLVTYLVTNASPDAFSLGSIMGVMQGASVFRSLALAGTGAAFSLSDDVSIGITNYSLWAAMATVSLGGAAVAYFVRDHPTVRDYSSSLKWEVCYESSEDLAI
ncbi:MFS general substrate transporter [Tuber magnatum]|uniref:MFS general substrate transporter n=1 Tax=Tuber magnatum TaxID=42249 RepID=A0A317SXU8_9PEZI|nr:MFS general substrate transporter [Tuber magnatum]